MIFFIFALVFWSRMHYYVNVGGEKWWIVVEKCIKVP